ncbi:MAG: hypothetical protein RBJ76_25010 [Stenomitos frigidus ULC029]
MYVHNSHYQQSPFPSIPLPIALLLVQPRSHSLFHPIALSSHKAIAPPIYPIADRPILPSTAIAQTSGDRPIKAPGCWVSYLNLTYAIAAR